jgi:hypothetical protein
VNELEAAPNKRFMFEHRRQPGRVDLVRTGNLVEARTSGVRRFTLLLSPDQFDFSQPVRATVNGRTAFDARVDPSTHRAARGHASQRAGAGFPNRAGNRQDGETNRRGYSRCGAMITSGEAGRSHEHIQREHLLTCSDQPHVCLRPRAPEARVYGCTLQEAEDRLARPDGESCHFGPFEIRPASGELLQSGSHP